MKKLALLLACFLLCGGWSHGRGPQTYTVSNSGSDSNDGLSAPWQTLGKVNSSSFNSGDTIKFDSASTFPGGISLTPANAPGYLTLTSTAAGQPTFNSGSVSCVKAMYMPGINVNNFNCAGGGASFPNIAGMYFIANSDTGHIGSGSISNPASDYMDGPKLTNNTIKQYGADGIAIFGSDQATNPSNWLGWVWATANNNVIDHVALGGYAIPGLSETAAINFAGGPNNNLSWLYTQYNVTANNNTITNTIGFPASGGAPPDQVIALTGVSIAMAQFNYINGFGSGTNACPSGVGIIGYHAAFITMQYNEATGGIGFGCDGEGFDFDGGVQSSVMQYNYAHNNSGNELLDCNGCGGGGTPGLGNNDIYRFNVAEAGANSGTMQVSVSLGTVNTQVYNNTFYSPVSQPFLIETSFSGSSTGSVIANNIFRLVGNATPSTFAAVNINGSPPTIAFTGNDYVSSNTFQWTIFGTTYTGLAAFQAAGFEKVAGNPVGTTSNPNLSSPGTNTLCATAPTVGAGWTASCPTGYDLTTASPAGKGNGLNLNTLYGYNVGTSDYFGNAVTNTTLPIGAAANQ
jgi:hypothetical protein